MVEPILPKSQSQNQDPFFGDSASQVNPEAAELAARTLELLDQLLKIELFMAQQSNETDEEADDE